MIKQTGKLLIRLEIQELTEKQRLNPNYLLRHKAIIKDSSFYLEALIYKLSNKYDLNHLPDNIEIVIKTSRTGKYKIDYSNIKERKPRVQIRQMIDSVLPIIC